MGPLDGVRVVEIAGIGPGPFCAMLLADMGAEVVRVDRPETAGGAGWPALMSRGRRSVVVDLKHERGAEVVLRLVEHADALLEGFRPGVAERLGIGPDDCLARNPRLVYGRMTGWGQDGPLRHAAGHDIAYIALAGALHPIGEPGGAPVPPLNLLGDFGGGGMLLAFGIACGLLEARRSGQGQVVDAAIVDGAALLTTSIHEMVTLGLWEERRGANLLDGGAPYYGVYETADGEHVAVGALEPKFYGEPAGGRVPHPDPGRVDRRVRGQRRLRRAGPWTERGEGPSAQPRPGHLHARRRVAAARPRATVQPHRARTARSATSAGAAHRRGALLQRLRRRGDRLPPRHRRHRLGPAHASRTLAVASSHRSSTSMNRENASRCRL